MEILEQMSIEPLSRYTSVFHYTQEITNIILEISTWVPTILSFLSMYLFVGGKMTQVPTAT